MKHLLTLLLLSLFLSPQSVHAQVQPAKADEKLRATAAVYRIFEAKCTDCHDAHLPKPKGKFGYVLDLDRVGKNPDYIVPGNLAKSELYQMVVHNEMPGEDADVPPLTPDELKVVAHWVMIGAPGALPPDFATNPTTAEAPAAPAPTASFFKRFLVWIGKFHPASTHFPVALLMTAAFAEIFIWVLRKPEWNVLVQFLVVLGALSAIPTATLGWMASFPTKAGSETEWVYDIHRILGTVVAGWGLGCAVMVCLPACKEGTLFRKWFRAALVLGGAMVALTGFLGGKLSFGLDHYSF